MRSQSLPITTIVLIIIVIVVLAAVLIFFFSGFGESKGSLEKQVSIGDCQSYCNRMSIIASKQKWVSSSDCVTNVCNVVPEFCNNKCADEMSCVLTFVDGTKARVQCYADGTCYGCTKKFT